MVTWSCRGDNLSGYKHVQVHNGANVELRRWGTDVRRPWRLGGSGMPNADMIIVESRDDAANFMV